MRCVPLNLDHDTSRPIVKAVADIDVVPEHHLHPTLKKMRLCSGSQSPRLFDDASPRLFLLLLKEVTPKPESLW